MTKEFFLRKRLFLWIATFFLACIGCTVVSAATISGHVEDSLGNPLANVCISAEDDACHGNYISEDRTDSAGNYSIPNLTDATNYYINTNVGCADISTDIPYFIDERYDDISSATGDCNAAASVLSGSTDIDFVLEGGGGLISGTLMSGGHAIIGIQTIGVSVFSGDCNNSQWVGYGSVDSITGTYTTSALPPGDYFLETNLEGTDYIREYWADPASVRDCASAQSITVTAGVTNSGNDFQLEKGGKIEGTLYDNSTAIIGEPSLGIDIYDSSPCNNQSGPIAYTHVNSTDGTYLTSGLAPGTYYLQVATYGSDYISEYWASAGSVEDCSAAEDITVIAEQTSSGSDFQLEKGGTISGTLFQSDGSTAIQNSDIGVSIFTGSGGCNLQHLQGLQINSDGTYTTPGLPTGTYYLRTWSGSSSYIEEYWATTASVVDCNSAEGIPVLAGTPITDYDFQLDQGIKVSGTVYESDGSTPILGGIAVNLFSGECTNLQYTVSTGASNQDGTYNLIIVQSGDYYLRAEPYHGSSLQYVSEYWASSASTSVCASATKITVGVGGTYDNRDFQLDVGGSIAGTIFETDGSTPVTNTNIYVDVYRNSPCGTNWDRAGGNQISTTDGTYTVSGLAPGFYYLKVNTSNSGYIDEFWADPVSVANCIGAQQVEVVANNIAPSKDFQLDMGATISGTLYDSNSNPITGDTGMRVHAYTGDPCTIFDYLGGENVDSNGTFTMIGVPDGSYYFRTKTNNDFVNEWSAGNSSSDFDCSQAVPVVISNGVNLSNVNFELETGYRVSGHVYESDGTTPIDALGRSLRLQVFQGDPCDTFSWVGDTRTFGVDGSYQTPALPDGSFFLRFKEAGRDQSDDLHQREWWAASLSNPDCSEAQAVVITGADILEKDFQIDLLVSKSPWSLFLPAILAGRK